MLDHWKETSVALWKVTWQLKHPKKKAAKRKPKAAVAATAAATTGISDKSVADAVMTTTTTAPAVPVAPVAISAPAPATAPSKIYYRAKEDNEVYAVSSIAIDDSVVTLKDLKKLLVDANEWPDSSRVLFYRGEERLAFTTALSDCVLENTLEQPLSVTVMTTTAAAISEVPAVQQQQQEGESLGTSRRLLFPFYFIH